MANTVFADAVTAERSLRDNGFKPHDHTGLDETLIDGDLKLAAQIAAFLCNKSQFEAQLRIVSEAMWKRYVTLDVNERNKFTRVIALVAEPYGFRVSTRLAPDHARGAAMQLKLIAGDPELGYMLRNKLFWKDSMHNRHGEYTHALQWLSIASKFGRPAARLYAQLGNYRANAAERKTVFLWQWLADCFPSDMHADAAGTVLKNGETLESQSYRSPQVITDYLVRGLKGPLKNHFVSSFLCMRYDKRGWISAATKDKEGNKLPMRKLQGDSKGSAEAKKADGQWSNSTRPGETGKARWVRDVAHDAAAVVASSHKTYAKSFHGLDGNLYEGG
ncbi:hypothetical protein HEP73_04255 [Xanthomonas sp. GW]|jgi:hypothetical protein|uniref:LirA/MavJ family T4SS effector n=1 Tax=unclassified Xanthomonas TaxID=2643310 RepID=UPI00163A1C1A|nr:MULTISPECIES: LirA/MavJ family T4SS effector [unclassified Xanthomonas]QNH14719.1 hypothetical protein HEP75_04192 [Xanthomonas sp. SI]QNH23302.1 hypothetical protein HEP73_04255 [Xanthomonas sp. GW]